MVRVTSLAILFPLSTLLASCGQAEAEKRDKEVSVVIFLRGLTRANASLRSELRDRYALSGQPRTARFVKYDFDLLYEENGTLWKCQANPRFSGGRHYYVDQSGVIREEKDKPATSESPVFEKFRKVKRKDWERYQKKKRDNEYVGSGKPTLPSLMS